MAIVNFTDIITTGFDEDALTTTTLGERVRNFGDLTTTGDLANGIFAGANGVTIKNRESIDTSGLGAAGIFVLGDDAHIENYGPVVTHGGVFGDSEFFSEGIFALGDRFSIANYGSVRVEGEFSSALVGDGADGLVVNFGTVDSAATGSSVVAAFGDRSQAINRGQVTVGGDDNIALIIQGKDASALNRGHILATGATSGGMGADENTHATNRGVISTTADGSFGMSGIVGGVQISNSGLIETHGTYALGIRALGRVPLDELGLDFEIVNAGHIATDGDLSIGVGLGLGSFGFANAADGQIENRGVIETVGDGAVGVVMIGNGHHLINSGRITTNGGAFDRDPVGELRAAGVLVSGDDALIENRSAGVIQSQNTGSAAVELNFLERSGLPAADMFSRLENFGLIKALDVAVLGGGGQETVVNHGRIAGDVVLGEGADIFVFGTGGALAGNLYLGDGDDLVVIENGAGRTNIVDFAAGGSTNDVINLSAFFSDFGELIAASSQRGSEVHIALDNNDNLVLANLQLNALNSDDFIFL